MKLTTKALENLSVHCCNTLKHLKLKWFPSFDVESLEHLSKFPILETLALKFFHSITSGEFSNSKK